MGDTPVAHEVFVQFASATLPVVDRSISHRLFLCDKHRCYMGKRMNLFCKIFVDIDISKDELVQKITDCTSGRIERWLVRTDWGEIDVVNNEDFDENRRGQEPDGFLFYRFYLEMEPGEGVPSEVYIKSVGTLLGKLWAWNAKAVAACDFEESLPMKGGYNAPNR